MEDIVEGETQKTFWKTVNEKRKKRQEVDRTITEVELIKHFKEQFSGED